jgi:hypothetical protein
VISPLGGGFKPGPRHYRQALCMHLCRSNVLRVKENGARQWADLRVVPGLAVGVLSVVVFPNEKFAPFSDLES